MDNFFQNASKLWTSAKANLLAGVAQFKDDAGIEQFSISNEFDTLNCNFVDVMRRSNQIATTFQEFCKNLIRLTTNLVNLSVSFEKCFAFCEGESVDNVKKLESACIRIKALTDAYIRGRIILEIIEPYEMLNKEGNPLYQVRSNIKSNFAMYQQYKKAYDNTYNWNTSEVIIENNRIETEK